MQLHFGGLILFFGGIYFLLMAFGVVRANKDPEKNELWMRKFGRMMKILAPIVILYGLAQFFGLLK